MNCPKDRSPMIVVEHQQIALDYCPTCRGVWFDRGELELVMEKACRDDTDLCLADIFHRREAATDEPKRRCPICNITMRKERLGTAPAVIVDVCAARTDGLWFDGGELHQVLSQIKSVDNGTVDAQMLVFLKETLKADIVG
jgi:hypothetical protein